MPEFVYAGKVEYVVDSSSIESIGFYYRLQSLNPDLNSLERAACERIAFICTTSLFRERFSIREAWETRLQQDALAEKDGYAKRVYDEAFRLVHHAR